MTTRWAREDPRITRNPAQCPVREPEQRRRRGQHRPPRPRRCWRRQVSGLSGAAWAAVTGGARPPCRRPRHRLPGPAGRSRSGRWRGRPGGSARRRRRRRGVRAGPRPVAAVNIRSMIGSSTVLNTAPACAVPFAWRFQNPSRVGPAAQPAPGVQPPAGRLRVEEGPPPEPGRTPPSTRPATPAAASRSTGAPPTGSPPPRPKINPALPRRQLTRGAVPCPPPAARQPLARCPSRLSPTQSCCRPCGPTPLLAERVPRPVRPGAASRPLAGPAASCPPRTTAGRRRTPATTRGPPTQRRRPGPAGRPARPTDPEPPPHPRTCVRPYRRPGTAHQHRQPICAQPETQTARCGQPSDSAVTAPRTRLRQHWSMRQASMRPASVRRIDFGYFIRPTAETESGKARVEPCLG